MLGDSLRRRGVQADPERPDRPERPRRNGRRRFTWWHWILLTVGVILGAFLAGYLLSVLVLFPAPETARGGISVPDLRGMTRTEAQAALTDSGLEIGRVQEMPSMDVQDGRVLAQDPLGEQQLRPGAAVDFTLSGGPPEIRVPPVAGLGTGTARALLEQSGFDVDIEPVPGDLPEGTVDRVAPSPGSELRLPAMVTLFVSIGPAPAVDSLPAGGRQTGPQAAPDGEDDGEDDGPD